MRFENALCLSGPAEEPVVAELALRRVEKQEVSVAGRRGGIVTDYAVGYREISAIGGDRHPQVAQGADADSPRMFLATPGIDYGVPAPDSRGLLQLNHKDVRIIASRAGRGPLDIDERLTPADAYGDMIKGEDARRRLDIPYLLEGCGVAAGQGAGSGDEDLAFVINSHALQLHPGNDPGVEPGTGGVGKGNETCHSAWRGEFHGGLLLPVEGGLVLKGAACQQQPIGSDGDVIDDGVPRFTSDREHPIDVPVLVVQAASEPNEVAVLLIQTRHGDSGIESDSESPGE